MQLAELATRQAMEHVAQAAAAFEVARRAGEREDEQARLRRMVGDDYSPIRALAAAAEGRSLVEHAPKEQHVSAALAQRIGRPAGVGGVYVPFSLHERTLTTANTGQYLTAPEVRIFEHALREASLLSKLPVSRFTGRFSQTAVHVTSSASAYWLNGETASITGSTPELDVLATSPKWCGALSETSRQWLIQADGMAQQFVLADMAQAVAEALDTAAIQGAGSAGVPEGVVSNSDVQTESGTSFGLTGATSALNKLEDAKAVRNRSALAWVIAPDAALLLRRREKASGNGYVLDGDSLLGVPCHVSAAVPDGTAILADWSALGLIDYQALELAVNRFGADAAKFQAGIAQVRALAAVDVVLLRPSAFVVVGSST